MRSTASEAFLKVFLRTCSSHYLLWMRGLKFFNGKGISKVFFLWKKNFFSVTSPNGLLRSSYEKMFCEIKLLGDFFFGRRFFIYYWGRPILICYGTKQVFPEIIHFLKVFHEKSRFKGYIFRKTLLRSSYIEEYFDISFLRRTLKSFLLRRTLRRLSLLLKIY